MRNKLLAIAFLLILSISTAWAGGTNSIFLRMNNMLNDMERQHSMSAEDIQDWRQEIQILQVKVNERVEKNGGGMNRIGDQDLFGEIDRQGKRLFEIYQTSKNLHN